MSERTEFIADLLARGLSREEAVEEWSAYAEERVPLAWRDGERSNDD